MTSSLGDILWGMPTVFLLLITGAFFTLGTKFFIIRHPIVTLKAVLGGLFKKGQKSHSAISPYEALCTALAGTLGTGNMAGTAAAIALGGPGAVFWMMVCAMFGMMTKAAECTLAVHFRVKTERGFTGGAMYYMRDGLGGIWKFIATFFALAMAAAALGTTAVQPYMMAVSVKNAFGVNETATVLVSSLLCAAVIFTGSKGASRFCAFMTPLLCLLYICGCCAVLIINNDAVPNALSRIINEAFSPSSAAGGLAGAAMKKAMSEGFSKSTFTHEAGMGAAPMVHASADASSSAEQGLLGAVEVFVDTIIICFLTALVILSGGEIQSNSPGIEITMNAFESALGYTGAVLVSVCCVLFAFSTMVGWIFEFETSMRWVFGDHPIIYRCMYLIPPLLTAQKSPEWIWQLVDICTGLVVIPNTVAILLLSDVFLGIFNEFGSKRIKNHR